MEVILSQDIQALGKEGDVVRVKEGYARNFLFPKKLAFEATQTNLKKIEQLKKNRQEKYDQEMRKAQEFADQLGKVSCTINVEVNDLEKMYGSITEIDIARSLKDEGFTVDKKNILLEKPIQELGIFEVNIKLHPEVIAKIRLWVTKK